jgi:drug/metabolite transporter (DMT)-like permease
MQLTIGAVSALIMEGLKWVVRKVMKQPEYDFPLWLYTATLAGLSILLVPAFAYLGLGEYEMPTDWAKWVIDILLAVLGALATYTMAIKPAKAYRREQLAKG